MKHKGLAHAVILGGLLAFVTLFLMTFLWNCFQVPSSAPAQESEKIISITTLDKEPPALPGLPSFVGNPFVQIIDEFSPVVETLEDSFPIPPPDHLIWLPRITELAKTPPKPRSLSNSSELYVPDIPYIFEPMVLSEEEFDMFFPVMSDPQALDDD